MTTYVVMGMDREKVRKGLEWILEDDRFGFGINWTEDSEPKSEEEHAGYNIQRAIDLLKEQDGTIKELQNAYGYLQKQFFEVQDELLKEHEKKPGEWIYKHDNLWYCSRCGEIIYSTNTDDLEIHHAYCSRCGAKMKQEGR